MGIFKAYDVRGIVGTELNDEVAERMGKAFAVLLSKHTKNKKVFLGRDNRGSSSGYSKAFEGALRSSGYNVIDLGIIPTPLMQFALVKHKAAGGCIVTASHNPPKYNGYKMYLNNLPLMESEMHELEQLFNSSASVASKKKGRYSKKKLYTDFINSAVSKLKTSSSVSVVVDTGNGTTGPLTRKILEKLNCKVTMLFEDIDSAFLNHDPDPSKDENLKWLQAEIKRTNADLGIALDGDGDRCVFLDEKGRRIRSDDIFIIFARAMNIKGRMLVHDLRFSKAVSEEIRKLGGKSKMIKVGRIALRNAFEKYNAILGGEVSSHFFFEQNYKYDDGIFAAAKMVEVISKRNAKISEIVSSIPHYPSTPELRLQCNAERKFKIVENVEKRLAKRFKMKKIDGIYLVLPDAWGSLRVSNTEAVLSMRFEGKTEEALKKIYDIFRKELKKEKIVLKKL